MISIAPRAFSLWAPLVLNANPASDIRGNERRITRTPTLDGGTVYTDNGFSDGDRTLSLQFSFLTKAQADAIEGIAALQSAVSVSVDGVCWDAYLISYSVSSNPRMRLAVRSKLSE